MQFRVGAACRPLGAVTVLLVSLLCLTGVALAEGGATAPSSNEAVLKKGDRGKAVQRLQAKLGVEPADGVFGRVTEHAVRRFQRRRGLTADGVVGPQTRNALGLKAASGAAAETSVRVPRALRKIARCESGGDPTVVSPNGRYRGKYQFTRATWRALGGSGDPAEASEAAQDRLALKLYRRSGTDPWPSCG